MSTQETISGIEQQCREQLDELYALEVSATARVKQLAQAQQTFLSNADHKLSEVSRAVYEIKQVCDDVRRLEQSLRHESERMHSALHTSVAGEQFYRRSFYGVVAALGVAVLLVLAL